MRSVLCKHITIFTSYNNKFDSLLDRLATGAPSSDWRARAWEGGEGGSHPYINPPTAPGSLPRRLTLISRQKRRSFLSHLYVPSVEANLSYKGRQEIRILLLKFWLCAITVEYIRCLRCGEQYNWE